MKLPPARSKSHRMTCTSSPPVAALPSAAENLHYHCPEIYEKYTGKSNQQVKENLKFLAVQENRGEIIARVPLIDGYNDFGDQLKTIEELESLHIKYETLTYTKNERLYFNENRLRGALYIPTDTPENTDGEELKKKQEQLKEEVRKWWEPEMGAFEDIKWRKDDWD